MRGKEVSWDRLVKWFSQKKSDLSLRTPEATSSAHTTAFNKHLVIELFNLLEGLILMLKVSGDRSSTWMKLDLRLCKKYQR